MNLMQFHRMRTAIQGNASPGRGPDLEALETRLRDVLMESGLFEEVEVEHTDDLDQLIIALCQFRPFLTEGDVAERLAAIWSDRIGYSFWEAHGLRTESDYVEFEAATRPGPEGGYVTVHLVAQKARIPVQRGSQN